MQDQGYYYNQQPGRRQGFFSQVKQDFGSLFGRNRGYPNHYSNPMHQQQQQMPPPPPPPLLLAAQPEQAYWPHVPQHGLGGLGSPRAPEYPPAVDPRNYMSPTGPLDGPTGTIKEVCI